MKEIFNINTGDIETLDGDKAPLIEAIKEISDASCAIDRMIKIGPGSFHKFERAWRDFLTSIDRVWNKTESRCVNVKGWSKFESKYKRLRKKDELLKYLIQARNVSEHSISEVVKEWDANLTAMPVQGGIQLNWKPWNRPLLPVFNRGETYSPPSKHLGKPLNEYPHNSQCEPIHVASLAMKFYVEMINTISDELFYKYV